MAAATSGGAGHWLELKVPPPVVALLLAAAAWWLAPLGPHLPWPDLLRRGLAGLLAISGLSLDFSGLVAFIRRHTTINPLSPRKSTALVTSGVYRYTRNPMYLGLTCLLTAWAVWLAALLPWAGPVLFVLYITRFQIQPEERVLTRLFGQPYADYTRRVRRWL